MQQISGLHRHCKHIYLFPKQQTTRCKAYLQRHYKRAFQPALGQQRQPCAADGLQCGEQRHNLPLIFFAFRLQKCQKKCIFAVCVDKKRI